MVSFKEVVEGAESRHEHRVERREGRREKRHARRVRFGEIVDQAELDSGEAVLDEVGPDETEPEADLATEPWGWSEKPAPGSVRERLAGYRAFLEEWRQEHHDDPVGDPDEEPEPLDDEAPDEEAPDESPDDPEEVTE
jgi:hypothetical protein